MDMARARMATSNFSSVGSKQGRMGSSTFGWTHAAPARLSFGFHCGVMLYQLLHHFQMAILSGEILLL